MTSTDFCQYCPDVAAPVVVKSEPPIKISLPFQSIEDYPHPNKSGPYAIKVGVCMPQQSGSHAIKVCESPFVLQKGMGLLCHTAPHFIAYFGAILSAT